PSFVEVRHIETGYLSQVIQCANIRLLFADTTNTVSPVQPYSHMGGGGYHYRNPYAPPNQHPARNRRDEILIVSDDRVFALRTLKT
ncbi:hypothetical protein C0991_007778, partial [Blastosporella zonata]